jgi:hypothetical protein
MASLTSECEIYGIFRKSKQAKSKLFLVLTEEEESKTEGKSLQRLLQQIVDRY